MRPCALLILSLLSLYAFAQTESGTFIPSSPRHTYREADILAAFPELRGDKKLSECSNSIMSGATELVFISDTDTAKNEVTIKTVHCTPVDKGLSCGAVRSARNYFLESPEHFFSLENLTFGQARPIVQAYKAGRHVYCSGCSAAFNVRLETDGTNFRLVYVGDPQSVCF